MFKYTIKYNNLKRMLGFIKELFGIYWYKQQVIKSFLEKTEIFGILNYEQLYSLSKRFKPVEYDTNDIISQEWKDSHWVWIIEHWCIEASKIINWKKEILWVIKRWGVYGEMAYFQNRKSSATLQTKSKTVWWEISKHDLTMYLKEHPNSLNHIKMIMEKRVSENKEKFHELAG